MNKSLILIIILLFPILLLGQNTRNPDYYCDLGIKFYEKGKYRDAAIEWEKALAISPNHQLANFYLVKATKEKNAIDFFAILGIKNYKQKNLEESLNNFNAIFEYDLNNEIATRYVNLINKDLDQNDELKANIINQFKKDAEQYQKKDDLISVKKGLALYNTLNLLNPGDTEVKKEKVNFKTNLK